MHNRHSTLVQRVLHTACSFSPSPLLVNENSGKETIYPNFPSFPLLCILDLIPPSLPFPSPSTSTSSVPGLKPGLCASFFLFYILLFLLETTCAFAFKSDTRFPKWLVWMIWRGEGHSSSEWSRQLWKYSKHHFLVLKDYSIFLPLQRNNSFVMQLTSIRDKEDFFSWKLPVKASIIILRYTPIWSSCSSHNSSDNHDICLRNDNTRRNNSTVKLG